MFAATQQVYRVTKPKGYQHVKVFTEELPKHLEKHEILVKINAVTLNYRDIAVANGTLPAPVIDQVIPGCDAAGKIVKVGSQVKDFKVGDRVVNLFDPTNLYGIPKKSVDNSHGSSIHGVLSQYKVFSDHEILKLPSDSHLTDAEAAALVCAGCTAWNSLFGSVERFIAGQTVLFLGTGGISITGLILAKAAGAVTIITSSSDDKLKYVKEKYGVDHCVNYHTHPDWEKEVIKATNGEGVDFVVENGGSGTIAKSLASVKQGGTISLVATEIPDITMLTLAKGATIRGIQIGSKQLFEELLRFVHAKKLRMPIEFEYGFSEEQVQSAYKRLESQTLAGKIVINVD
ncbi:hypothetical protein BC943DRAFT_345138 [Umbelopsis sp. AD052]|nr:hypothetical protein BC943DRAFT_345138 [Umbelopsis sp. AD052]